MPRYDVRFHRYDERLDPKQFAHRVHAEDAQSAVLCAVDGLDEQVGARWVLDGAENDFSATVRDENGVTLGRFSVSASVTFGVGGNDYEEYADARLSEILAECGLDASPEDIAAWTPQQRGEVMDWLNAGDLPPPLCDEPPPAWLPQREDEPEEEMDPASLPTTEEG
jgi:hypothetical protein